MGSPKLLCRCIATNESYERIFITTTLFTFFVYAGAELSKISREIFENARL
jgi:hypothetical protein